MVNIILIFRGHELTPADQQLMAEADEIIQKCGGDPRGWNLYILFMNKNCVKKGCTTKFKCRAT